MSQCLHYWVANEDSDDASVFGRKSGKRDERKIKTYCEMVSFLLEMYTSDDLIE